MKWIHVCALLTFLLAVEAANKPCDRCLPRESCSLFGSMSRKEQQKWIKDNSCDQPSNDKEVPFGFSSVAKGDYVCCPGSNVWGVQSSPSSERRARSDSDDYSVSLEDFKQHDHRGHNTPNPHRPGGTSSNHVTKRPTRPNVSKRPNGSNRPNANLNNNRPNGKGPNNNHPPQNSAGQCSSMSALPPDPQTGCCGVDALTKNKPHMQNSYENRPSTGNNHRGPSGSGRYPRDAPVEVSIDDRITGGHETQFEQFPWTVLLKTTFDYGNKKAAFNCGGSLISPRYVLTAAHCVVDNGAKVADLEITLSEYDKRTFPQDCVNIPGQGKKCIENKVVRSEEIVHHPDFNDENLENDVALIRLRENVPFTDFIRPICLPPIDIDNPQYSDLRVAVAGWGRNGSVTSQVKQSTVVNIVPQKQCVKSYPTLTRKHLCAAGHSGEDTCKGDSGGPLMMLYEGKYYVSGIVSGKRADSPCGTSVPSLYTNVYTYMDWIKRNIRS